MTIFPFLAAGLIIKLFAVLFVICSVALIQKGRGGGLSAAFTGGAASGILGSKTGDFLTWVTIVLVSAFLILAIMLAKFYKPGPTVEFDAAQPAGQTQPVRQQPPAEMEQPLQEIPSVAPDADEGGDADLPGG